MMKKYLLKLTSIALAVTITMSSFGAAGFKVFAEEKASGENTTLAYTPQDFEFDPETGEKLTTDDPVLPNVVSDEENDKFWEKYESMSEEEQSALMDQIFNEYINENSNLNFEDMKTYAEDGSLEFGKDDVKGGLSAGMSSLVTANPGAFAGWYTSTVFELIFGKEEDKVQKTLEEIKKSLEQINKKLDEVIELLKKLGKQVEAKAVEDDLRDARAAIKDVATFMDTFKASALMKKNASKDEKKAAYDYLIKNFPELYKQVNKLSHYLADQDNVHTHKSLYYNIRWLAINNNCTWDTQQMEFQTFENGAFTTSYIACTAALLAIKGYQMTQVKKGSSEYNNLQMEFNVTVNNAKKVKAEMQKQEIVQDYKNSITLLLGNNAKIPMSKSVRNVMKVVYKNNDRNFFKSKDNWNDIIFARESIQGTEHHALNAKGCSAIQNATKALINKGALDKNMKIGKYFRTSGFDISNNPAADGTGTLVPTDRGSDWLKFNAEDTQDYVYAPEKMSDFSSNTHEPFCYPITYTYRENTARGGHMYLTFLTTNSYFSHSSSIRLESPTIEMDPPKSSNSETKIVNSENSNINETGSVFSQPVITIAIIGGILVIAVAITTPVIIKKRKKDNEI